MIEFIKDMWIPILLIVACAVVLSVIAITDDRECIKEGPPIYMRVGEIMMPVAQCAEYAPE